MSQKSIFFTTLFSNTYGVPPDVLHRLPGSGSSRVYYKMEYGDVIVLGAYNEDVTENAAFFSFSEHFFACGLPVPKIIAVHSDRDAYLLEYLGDMTLYDFLSANRNGKTFSPQTVDYYRKVVAWLPKFQVEAGKGIDYTVCYPRVAFDEQSIQWDLNYFKYYFVKLSGVAFNEQRLENDFKTLTAFLLEAPGNYFLYRDFQSRNVMVRGDDVYFIDYQGGRKGALQYDIASLLWDAKADMPHETRNELLDLYLDELSKIIPVNSVEFKKYYHAFVLVRILQALGTYGYRGFYERKSHFLQSIPYALQNLRWLFDNVTFPVAIAELINVLKTTISHPPQKTSSFSFPLMGKMPEAKGAGGLGGLTVSIHSFSYRKGILHDTTGNGGGHVFDCRILPNPGQEPQYQNLTGRDKEVKTYLDNLPETETFFNHVEGIVNQSVERYIWRGFSNLMVSFGCTGGQHRSVYCAERMVASLREQFPDVRVLVCHHVVGEFEDSR